jgi:RNA polymerase sigma factor (sigma-70 family)
MDETHPSLLVRLRDARDAGAWSTFVDVYGPLVFSECRRRGLQHQDAEDVTQRVFERSVKGLREFRYERQRGRFRDWLGTIVRNEVYRFTQQRSRKSATQPGSDYLEEAVTGPADPEWNDAFQERILQVALDRCQPHFEPDTWAAFTAVWSESQPATDVAKQLNMPIDKVYVAKSRVLKRLTTIVEELCEEIP